VAVTNPGGPAFGLRSQANSKDKNKPDGHISGSSQAWLMGCTLTDNAPAATGDISAQDGCRVYSNNGPSGFPFVLERSSGKLVNAWKLTEKNGSIAPPRGAQQFDATPFATESDKDFQNYVQVWPLPHAHIIKVIKRYIIYNIMAVHKIIIIIIMMMMMNELETSNCNQRHNDPRKNIVQRRDICQCNNLQGSVLCTATVDVSGK
jgi:hypothetical protein